MNDTLYDTRGVAHTALPEGEIRIVSLVPSTTETVFALGLGDALVGYTRFCVHPADMVTPDKWIGGTKNPKLDKIIALAPDIVLANREENRAEDVEALEVAGLRVWVAEPRTVSDAITDIERLGQLLGRAAKGEALAQEIATHYAAPSHGNGATAAYLIWRNPYMVAGRETFITDMLAQGGFVNVFAGRYPEVTIEDLRSVDVVMLSSEPFPFGEAHRAELVAAGVAAERIRFVDGERLSWHGVRLREGLPYIKLLAQTGAE